MRVIKQPPAMPREVEVTCTGCEAVLGVKRMDAETTCYGPETVHVFRCECCGQHLCIGDERFDAGAGA